MSLRPTKIVEWFGGPRDGERFVMDAQAQYVIVPLPLIFEFVQDDGQVPKTSVVDTFRVPIMKRGDGRFVAVWSAE